jgi:hypothetical protein
MDALLGAFRLRRPQPDRTDSTGGMTMAGAASDSIGYEADIKSLFREGDRKAMLSAFDLWSHADVRDNADAILRAVATGSMPCDTNWPPDQVAVFRRWVEAGKPA